MHSLFSCAESVTRIIFYFVGVFCVRMCTRRRYRKRTCRQRRQRGGGWFTPVRRMFYRPRRRAFDSNKFDRTVKYRSVLHTTGKRHKALQEWVSGWFRRPDSDVYNTFAPKWSGDEEILEPNFTSNDLDAQLTKTCQHVREELMHASYAWKSLYENIRGFNGVNMQQRSYEQIRESLSPIIEHLNHVNETTNKFLVVFSAANTYAANPDAYFCVTEADAFANRLRAHIATLLNETGAIRYDDIVAIFKDEAPNKSKYGTMKEQRVVIDAYGHTKVNANCTHNAALFEIFLDGIFRGKGFNTERISAWVKDMLDTGEHETRCLATLNNLITKTYIHRLYTETYNQYLTNANVLPFATSINFIVFVICTAVSLTPDKATLANCCEYHDVEMDQRSPTPFGRRFSDLLGKWINNEHVNYTNYFKMHYGGDNLRNLHTALKKFIAAFVNDTSIHSNLDNQTNKDFLIDQKQIIDECLNGPSLTMPINVAIQEITHDPDN